MDRVKSFFQDDQVYFMTLTMRADDHSDIMQHWHVLYQRLKYYYPGLRVFWVKEKTKRGIDHLHCIVTRSIDGKWLSRAWLEITKTSFIVKIDNSSEIMNAAGYMLKYMTKAHENILQYNKGERLYGFNGARSPPTEKLGYNEEPLEFVLGQHYNPSSKYWMTYYNNLQVAIGRPFIEYMSFLTLDTLDKIKVLRAKLNSKSPSFDECLPKVKLSSSVKNDSIEKQSNTEKWSAWKKILDARLNNDQELKEHEKRK